MYWSDGNYRYISVCVLFIYFTQVFLFHLCCFIFLEQEGRKEGDLTQVFCLSNLFYVKKVIVCVCVCLLSLWFLQIQIENYIFSYYCLYLFFLKYLTFNDCP